MGPEQVPHLNMCMSSSREKGTISITYSYLNEKNLPAKSLTMLGWEEETGQENSPGDWVDMLSNMHKIHGSEGKGS